MTGTATADLPIAERLRIADVLDRAADVLDRVGLHQGTLWDHVQADQGTPRAEARQCAMGAIATAICGEPSTYALGTVDALGLWDAAVQAVEDTGAYGVGPGHLGTWNDVTGRTEAEVAAAFRNTARILRGGVPR